MCRILAIPAGFKKKEALDILQKMLDNNTDGTGYAYVKSGVFVVEKWPISLIDVVKKKSNFLNHLPYDGWTIIHLRLASHGKNLIVNTHPFVVKDWCVIHNGIWSEYGIAKLAMGNSVKIYGDTDSEIAANLINIAGPKKFAEEVTFGGVFLSLNKNGELWAIKTNGDLVFHKLSKKKLLIASELDYQKYPSTEATNGWYRLNPKGEIINYKQTREFWYFNGNHWSNFDNSEESVKKVKKIQKAQKSYWEHFRQDDDYERSFYSYRPDYKSLP